MSKIKWKNVPIPPQHLVGLLIGSLLHFWFTQRLFSMSWVGVVLGIPLILFGIWISLRSTIEAAEMSIDSPTNLLTTGPYSYSRNPMYVGWSSLYLGIGLAVNSFWIIVFFPLVFIFTHVVDIRREEQLLKDEFADEYLEYQKNVKRYL